MATLYLIRHGLAVDREPEQPDADRPLTAAGIQKTRQVAARLVDSGLSSEYLLTSPLVRAYQTAQILVEAKFAPDLQQFPALAPEGSLTDAIAWLATKPTDSAIAWVGHEPNLSIWAETLIWGESQDKLMLKKAGIIGLTLPPQGSPVGNSRLFWLTPPRLFLP